MSTICWDFFGSEAQATQDIARAERSKTLRSQESDSCLKSVLQSLAGKANFWWFSWPNQNAENYKTLVLKPSSELTVALWHVTSVALIWSCYYTTIQQWYIPFIEKKRKKRREEPDKGKNTDWQATGCVQEPLLVEKMLLRKFMGSGVELSGLQEMHFTHFNWKAQCKNWTRMETTVHKDVTIKPPWS